MVKERGRVSAMFHVQVSIRTKFYLKRKKKKEKTRKKKETSG